MLGLAKKKNCSFLLASTSEVYGDPLINPQPESYRGNVNQVGPRGVYDEAKRFAEAIVTAYHKVHGIDVKIARIFNTYGPRMRRDDGRVIPNFIMQALQGKPLTIYGNGKQTRSFCYISDMIDGIYKLLLSECNEPVNLGNPESISVLELADLVIKIVGSRSGKVFLPLPEDDPKLRCPDISKARKIIGWEPRVSLEEGIRNTVDYFRKLSSCY
jgi:dTDP-glucose 4,6-dehydratase